MRCVSCGDPVCIVRSVDKPLRRFRAKHCSECFLELFHGVIPFLEGPEPLRWAPRKPAHEAFLERLERDEG